MLIRYIFYAVVFYFVMKILRNLFDPMFEKKENSTMRDNTNFSPKTENTPKPKVGEYIDFEEIK